MIVSEFEVGELFQPVPRCVAEDVCDFPPCNAAGAEIFSGYRQYIGPRFPEVPSVLDPVPAAISSSDAERLLAAPHKTSWQRWAAADMALDAFAAAGDAQSVLRVASALAPNITSINRLMRSAPYSRRLYTAARDLAKQHPDLDYQIEMNRVIESYRFKNLRIARKTVRQEVRQDLRLLGDRTATIMGHGQLPEGAEPAVQAGTIGAV